MPNILKSWKDFASVEDWIANTQVANSSVADIFAPITGAKVILGSTNNFALDNNADIQAIINDSSAFDTYGTGETILVYRSQESFFRYTKSNGKTDGFFIPSGSKVAKIGEHKGADAAIVIVWKSNNYYRGVMPLEALNPSKTQNLISPAGFLNDAKHTLFRFERRVQQNKHTQDAFVGRILAPIRQAIRDFETLFADNPKGAETRLKSAFEKYKERLLLRSSNKVEIVKRHLDAIFAANDFMVNGEKFSEQVRVLPVSLEWFDKYDEKDKTTLRGYFVGESGEGMEHRYPGWQNFIVAINHLLDITANGEGKNTPEGQWLLENITPALLENNIKEIICIHNATWNFNALNNVFASGIPLRDIHGPFFTSALFTVITHELNVNAFTNLFTPDDTHIYISSDIIQKKVLKENYLTVLNDATEADALYQSHSYLSVISLTYVFKLMQL